MIVSRRDEQIHAAVLARLRSDGRVRPTEIGVEVDDGVVTLSGTVESYAKRLAARDVAHEVEGVLDVADDVLVNPPFDPFVTDTDLAHRVRHALESAGVPHGEIRSTVCSGWVTLEGVLDTPQQRIDAELALTHLDGLMGVDNKLVLRASANSGSAAVV
jgi:osmotically-inducible protein OsmY